MNRFDQNIIKEIKLEIIKLKNQLFIKKQNRKLIFEWK